MSRNPTHNLLPPYTAEDHSRHRFIMAMKKYLGRQIRPKLRHLVDPSLTSEDQIEEALYGNDIYQTWCALSRASQEQMWQSVLGPLEKDRTRIEGLGQTKTKGSLALDPDLTPPEAMQKINVHLQPGGYLANTGETDMMAGALYECGGALYSRGQGIGTTESKAQMVMRFMTERYPDFKPRRILDMGCSAGSSSVPYAEAFPDAEVHAIDIGAGMLRYAHARAEQLGQTVHFHQQRIEQTSFEDQSFDLVISHNLMHELSLDSQQAMMREAYRLLKPGGLTIHQDLPIRYKDLDTYTRVDLLWDKYFNGEPFWDEYANNDGEVLLNNAGFDGDMFIGKFDQIDKTFSWYLIAAQKEDQVHA